MGQPGHHVGLVALWKVFFVFAPKKKLWQNMTGQYTFGAGQGSYMFWRMQYGNSIQGASGMPQTKYDIDNSIPQEFSDNGALSGVEVEPEFHEFPFDADKISISSVPVPITRLLDRLKANTISAPQIQRSANLWDSKQQSRLI